MTTLPPKDEILKWISDNPTLTSKRDISKAFGIKGTAKIDLKRILKKLEAEGHLTKRKKTYRDPEVLPPVSVLMIGEADGDLFAEPLEWQGEGTAPRILMAMEPSEAALKKGDRILGRLTKVNAEDHAYQARIIRKIGHNPITILGLFRANAKGGRIVPIDKGADREWVVPAGADDGAKDGELVEAQQIGPKSRMGLPKARVIARLGDPMAPRAVSLIAIHQHGIPDQFPDKVISEADAQKPAGLKRREDLRHLPLVTIDPHDARDHDDAVYAHADEAPNNPGGHVVWVAIADVAHHVQPGSELNHEARKRGNSTYFPDRVVPMLPDRLSGDLCSLHEGVPRACLAVRMVLDAKGHKINHSFIRGLMLSHASLNYADVQAAQDGAPNEKCAPLMKEVIAPLYDAYAATKLARADRQPLDLDLQERKIVLREDGKVASVNFAKRLDAHRLIEEFMILTNVAAAEELIRLQHPLLFRVHEEPSPQKLDALREVAQASGFTFAKGQVLKAQHLNQLLSQAEGSEFDELVNISTLRSMTKAYYHHERYGHFGLALKAYAHFTSPIRRYSDLIVHRALISGHNWGEDGLSPQDVEHLEATAKQVSQTERRSTVAERDTNDRYLASYLSERVGNEFTGCISGVPRFGLFVKLDEIGADGLIPISSIGTEYFRFVEDEQRLIGEQSGISLGVGARVTVRLAEAIPITGGLILELLTLDGKALPRRERSRKNYVVKRKANKERRKQDKIKRKITRK